MKPSLEGRESKRRSPSPGAREPKISENPPADAPARDETLADCLRKLVQLFPQVSRGLRRRQVPRPVIDDAALGPRHGAALSLIREHGPATVGCLAHELGLTLASASGIVADVERAGFVKRSPDPDDRRRTIVSVVPGQSAAISSWIDGVSEPMARALGRLSPEERGTFVKAMTYLEAELNATPRAQPLGQAVDGGA